MHDYENYKYYDQYRTYILTETENELLDLFINNKNRLITRDMICQKLYLEEYRIEQASCITRLISNLRNKFKLHIVTVHGRGYILRS